MTTGKHQSLTYCEVCGDTWGGYAVGVDQHYCLNGRRVTRSTPTETEMKWDQARLRDPYVRRQEEQAAFYRRHGK